MDSHLSAGGPRHSSSHRGIDRQNSAEPRPRPRQTALDSPRHTVQSLGSSWHPGIDRRPSAGGPRHSRRHTVPVLGSSWLPDITRSRHPDLDSDRHRHTEWRTRHRGASGLWLGGLGDWTRGFGCSWGWGRWFSFSICGLSCTRV